MANELKVGMIESILALKALRWSNRRIALELDLDRGTVAKYLEQAGWDRALGKPFKTRHSAHRVMGAGA